MKSFGAAISLISRTLMGMCGKSRTILRRNWAPKVNLPGMATIYRAKSLSIIILQFCDLWARGGLRLADFVFLRNKCAIALWMARLSGPYRLIGL